MTTHFEAQLPACPHSGFGWMFFRQWLRNPFGIAALSPSSRHLARLMVNQLPASSRRVVELGGGTGVFTRALLQEGIAPQDLLVVELNPALHDLLSHRFPGVGVIHGDACELAALLASRHAGAPQSVDAIVSGLGLLSMSRATQRCILLAAFSVMSPEGCFIQFTYGPASPVSRELLAELGLAVRRGGIAWVNVPPATVYVYTRSRTRGIRAVRVPVTHRAPSYFARRRTAVPESRPPVSSSP